MLIIILLMAGLLAQTPPQSKPAPPAAPVLQSDPQTQSPAKPSQRPASEPQEVAENDVIRVDTTLVNVPVSVLEHNGKYVPDLRKEDFRVWEDGVEQQLVYFAPVEKPFTVALLLDISDSTTERLPEIKEAAIAFVEQLRPDDRVMVLSFDSRITILSEATSDRKQLRQAIMATKPGQGTRLYDALDFAVNHRLNKVTGRRAVVLFTDGVDTYSRATALGTIRDVEEQDVLVYPVQYETERYVRDRNPASTTLGIYNSTNPTDFNPYKQAQIYMRTLADRTGGQLYNAGHEQSIAKAFAQVAEMLRWQYSLGYYPNPAGEPGTRHKVKVRVSRPKVAVRAKQSYVRLPKPEAKK